MQPKNSKTAVCEFCGETFDALDWRVRPRRFCSLDCRNKRNAKLKAPAEYVERICEVCEKPFAALAKEVKRGNGKVCSPACQRKFIGKKRSQKVRIVCANEDCQKVFWKSPSLAANRRFCSRACHSAIIRGPIHHCWKGEDRVMPHGYCSIYMPTHPNAYKGWVYEHIVIAEQMIGRPVREDEEVHHKNLKRSDNRPENLVVLTTIEHRRLHARLRWEPAGAFTMRRPRRKKSQPN